MKELTELYIHLVDDNDIDIAVNTKLLQLSKISDHIYSYNGAIRFLKEVNGGAQQFEGHLNVVLLDIMMPIVNGFDCLDQLQVMPEETRMKFKIFMLSSSIDRNDIRKAESYPMVEKILEKPLDVYLFKKFLEETLGC
jgi:CheY-like chemotaxis protein